MAKYGSKDVRIEFDNSSGTLVDMTQHIKEIGGFTLSAKLEEAHTFGATWMEHVATGLKKHERLQIRGFYDDTPATGSDVIFNAIGDQRTLKLTWGGTNTTSVETIIADYKRLAVRGELNKYEVTLQPIGAVTET